MFTTEGNLGDYCKTTAFDHKGNNTVMYWWLSHSFEFYMIYMFFWVPVYLHAEKKQQWNVSFEAFVCQSYSRWPCKVVWKLRSHRRICQPTPLRICWQNRMKVKPWWTMQQKYPIIWWISNEYRTSYASVFQPQNVGLKTGLLVGFFAIFQSVLTRRVQWDSRTSQFPNGHFLYVLGFICNTSHYSIWWVVIGEPISLALEEFLREELTIEVSGCWNIRVIDLMGNNLITFQNFFIPTSFTPSLWPKNAHCNYASLPARAGSQG